jgi:hypothetical protein
MEDLLDQMNGRLSRAGEATSVAADVRSVAQAVVELAASLSEQIAAARAEAVELHDRLALDEIAALRDEISQLRRRLGVRAKAPVVLTESQIDDVADRVVSRMVELFEVDASTAEAAAPAEPRAPRSKRSRPLVGRDGG